jgi:lysophospholipase L1-like esterase
MKFTLKRICSILFILGAIAFISFSAYRKAKMRRTIEGTLASPHWQERFRDFKAQPRNTGRIVFLGNSLTELFDLNLFGDSTLINRGITGDFTEGLLKRLDEVISLKPSRLFIEIGINDLVEKVSVREVCSNYRKIITRVQEGSPQTKIYIQSILPVRMIGSLLTSSDDVNEVIREENEELRTLAEELHVTYVDLYCNFVINQEMNHRLTWDGVHLVDEGYQIWKGCVSALLH